MKILILHDLHLDLTHFSRLSVLPSNVDYLIVAGDLSAFRGYPDYLRRLLDGLTPKNVGLIAGNHEFYNDSLIPMSQIEDEIKYVCKQKGIVYLQEHNIKLSNLTIVGNCLWYDYSFVNGQGYSEKLLVSGNGYQWNDMNYISRGKKTDAQITARMNSQLKDRLKEAAGDKLLVVTHMCPTPKLNAHPMGIFNAYSGNVDAGKILDKYNGQIDKLIAGHTHVAAKWGNWTNIGNDYDGDLKFSLIDIAA